MEHIDKANFDHQTPKASASLACADTATMVLVLAEAMRDDALLDQWTDRVIGPSPEASQFTELERASIEARFADLNSGQLASSDYRYDDLAFNTKLFSFAAGRKVGTDEQQMLLKEMGIGPEVHVDWKSSKIPAAAGQFKVAITGAGLSGIAMGIRLKRLGIPFTIFDVNDDIGGTWLVNTYPGCGVDVASHYFSYSFERSAEWTRYYAKQPEILAYLQACVDKYGLRPHLSLKSRISSATYDEKERLWNISVEGPFGLRDEKFSVLITAVGQLSVPKTPKFPGLEDFKGRYCHSAAWDDDMEIDGKRVALVGGGASANQIGPAIGGRVARLTVVQRSPHWMTSVKRYQSQVSEQEQDILRSSASYSRWFRIRSLLSINDVARQAALIDPDWQGPDGTINAASEEVRRTLTAYIRSELGDREDLISALIPDYPPYLKRMLRDNGWYRLLKQPNVSLVDTGLSHFVEDGFVDGAGNHTAVDEVIFATGFAATDMISTVDIRGRAGRRLHDAWKDENPRAFLGISVPEFPNMFVLYGPNTNIGTGGSIIFQAEAQSSYIAQLLTDMIENEVASVEIRQDVHVEYNERMDLRLEQMVWSLPSADTWCRNQYGRVTANMPWALLEYWHLARKPKLNEYLLVKV